MKRSVGVGALCSVTKKVLKANELHHIRPGMGYVLVVSCAPPHPLPVCVVAAAAAVPGEAEKAMLETGMAMGIVATEELLWGVDGDED